MKSGRKATRRPRKECKLTRAADGGRLEATVRFESSANGCFDVHGRKAHEASRRHKAGTAGKSGQAMPGVSGCHRMPIHGTNVWSSTKKNIVPM